MTDKPLPSPELLRKLLRYEPETGKLYWMPRPPSMYEGKRRRPAQLAATWNTQFAGTEALAYLTNGYPYGQVLGRSVSAHRVIWAMAYGAWATGVIDHINGITTDNRLENLREVTHSANMQNSKRTARNTSGTMGVHFEARGQRWIARVVVDGTRRHIGTFRDKQDAITAVVNARPAHGYHQNHDRPNST
ncbi:HNH endonuclease signature motif containing protein [Sphingomonas sp. 1P08PE]|uniref:HNH endonuclease signature motif containing protein n=1 Tax=Sphingomonas sp. 1P08PE TaxID=554122 RepID=UPI00399F74A7